MLNVHVEENVPLFALGGTLSLNVSVTVEAPSPVAAPPSNSLTAAGAVAAAGSVAGKAIALVGSRQVADVATTEPAVMVVAVVGSVLEPAFLNVVEVPARFHPLALPVLSVG